MYLDFGRVIHYSRERGFGYASHEFRSSSEKVLFYTSQIKLSDPGLAEYLDGSTDPRPVFFWYEYRLCPRGHEATSILTPKQAYQKYPGKIEKVVDLARSEWTCIKNPLLKALRAAAQSLLSMEEIDRLTMQRKIQVDEQRRRDQELSRAKAAKAKELAEQRARKREAELDRLKAISDQRAAEESEKEAEFWRLVAEMMPHGFSQSSQVSAYIVRQRLGHKYHNISGILKMERDGDEWDFNGGFPPDIYARLCDELGLRGKGSLALPVEFTPYKDILEH